MAVEKRPSVGPEDRVKVRTTFRPEREVEMTATEAEDLRRQGLLVPAGEAPAQVDRELDQTEEKPEPRQRPAGKGETK